MSRWNKVRGFVLGLRVAVWLCVGLGGIPVGLVFVMCESGSGTPLGAQDNSDGSFGVCGECRGFLGVRVGCPWRDGASVV